MIILDKLMRKSPHLKMKEKLSGLRKDSEIDVSDKICHCASFRQILDLWKMHSRSAFPYSLFQGPVGMR